MMKNWWNSFKHWWNHGIELQQPHRNIKGMIAYIDAMEPNQKERKEQENG